MQHDHIQKKALTQPQGPRVCVRTEHVLLWRPTLHSLQFEMQHDYFQKKKCFELLTQPLGTRMCVRTEYVLAWCSMLHSL